jgi:hypothetical protein
VPRTLGRETRTFCAFWIGHKRPIVGVTFSMIAGGCESCTPRVGNYLGSVARAVLLAFVRAASKPWRPPWSVCLPSIFMPTPWKEGSMNQPRTYLWLPAYLSAVLETDNALMPTRIYEALAAIEQRLLSPIEADEYKEIENAQRGLLTLKVERVDYSSAPATTNCRLIDGHRPA